MEPQLYLLVNSIIVSALVASLYLVRFQRPRPTRLNLRAKVKPVIDSAGRNVTEGRSQPNGSALPVRTKPSRYGHINERMLAGDEPIRPVYELCVMFNYNGHTFEAYEALGLAPGSSIESAELAFQAFAQRLDPESRVFYELALQAIQASRQHAS